MQSGSVIISKHAVKYLPSNTTCHKMAKLFGLNQVPAQQLCHVYESQYKRCFYEYHICCTLLNICNVVNAAHIQYIAERKKQDFVAQNR